ncbi:MAG: hydrogenase-4 component [Clostridiales bacterium]|nr:hydrogenase-4 component [Clostridiales bacterium]MDN5281326.1 hydrogenase-4 component [Candidatus Ozemobacter sp.]
MDLFIYAIVIIVTGGFLSSLSGRNAILPSVFAIGSNLFGAILVFILVFRHFAADQSFAGNYDLFLLSGPVTFRIDSLSAFFMIPCAILAPIGALFGRGYLSHSKERTNNHWFFYNLLVASMLSLFVAGNAILFLISWEFMTVAAFMLTLHDDRLSSSKNAAWLFFAASHLSTGFLFLFFAFLASKSGSFDFNSFSYTGLGSRSVLILFLLSLTGFGTKAGFFPFHVWLPEAHPAAPSHVSALMSGVMIKTGIYGLVRFWVPTSSVSEMIGWIFLVGGLISGLFAIINALACDEIKKVLAYSSVENAGIIFMALGAGMLAREWQMPTVSAFAFIGALLHVLNHAIFKGLLFMGAGSLLFACDTGKLDRLGGLMKRIPVAGTCFVIASMAISALPPFNGFISEFLIFSAGLRSIVSASQSVAFMSVILLCGLALIGGLVLICFTRIAGLVFLGETRSREVPEVVALPAGMKWSMIILALFCLGAALASPWIVSLSAESLLSRLSLSEQASELDSISRLLLKVNLFSLSLLVTVMIFYLIRKKVFSGGDRSDLPTWDCGFAKPDNRMQYSASSFSRPALELFSGVKAQEVKFSEIKAYYPVKERLKVEQGDGAMKYIISPPIRWLDRLLLPLRALQHGRLHSYIAYLAITLLALLIWKVGLS